MLNRRNNSQNAVGVVGVFKIEIIESFPRCRFIFSLVIDNKSNL